MASKRQAERMTPMSAMHDPVECPVCFDLARAERSESSFTIAAAMGLCAAICAVIWFACIYGAPLVTRWISEVGR